MKDEERLKKKFFEWFKFEPILSWCKKINTPISCKVIEHFEQRESSFLLEIKAKGFRSNSKEILPLCSRWLKWNLLIKQMNLKASLMKNIRFKSKCKLKTINMPCPKTFINKHKNIKKNHFLPLLRLISKNFKRTLMKSKKSWEKQENMKSF